MSGTAFDFLIAEFPELRNEAVTAGRNALAEPRTACFYARRAVEIAIKWAFEHDRSLQRPYDDAVSTLLNEPSFKALVGEQIYMKAREIIRLGNRAVHETSAPSQHDSVAAVSHLFQFSYWFARTYAKAKPPADLTFDPRTLPKPQPVPTTTAAQMQALQQELDDERRQRAAAEAALTTKAELEAELERLRREVAMAKAAAATTHDDHDYSEAETRDYFIDLLLKEAGWTLSDARDREYEVTGMPDGKLGYADYVLWGDDGKPLAVIEAKRTRREPRVGQQQAKLYADCLEKTTGQRPIIFYTNGYEHWLWDDHFYPSRRIAGFLKKDELDLRVQRRATRASLGGFDVNPRIVERYYQTRAIRRIGESLEADNARKALLVMATGSGKTRTVVALSDVLIRANWVKRVLFLADRTALVKQAVNAFKMHLPDASPVNLVTERHEDGRVFVSTYPTMMNLINTPGDGERRFGPGFFDLVVIDEAHRSVFQKYGAILEYFDALLVGLTATPRDEVDRNTYRTFGLEEGVPTDVYGIEEGVADGYLVPPKAVSVPSGFIREGIRYDDLSEEEKDQWDDLDWGDEDDVAPDEVRASDMNKWLFNADTVDKVLEHLMTQGLKVAGGDRLGKTIIFAASQRHAEFVAVRFDANYPHYRGEFARIITNKTEYAQDLIDKFSIPASAPHIAISVDMLDTGIDVLEIVNLVFFKPVRSKTKFWQMLGRGTRVCPDLFGPGQDKFCFYVFDWCMNLEYFNQHPESADGLVTPPLAERLFVTRLDLISALDETKQYPEERRSIAELLRVEVASMNLDNFVVRPHRRLVERFRGNEGWKVLHAGDLSELANEVAGLPSELDPEPEEARRFDLLLLATELALLRAEPGYDSRVRQIRAIASLLEGYPAIPSVAREMPLILDLQTDEWWADVTVPIIESVRRRLRMLVSVIEKRDKRIVYADFQDQIGAGVEITLDGLNPEMFNQFRKKAHAFLNQHRGEWAIKKLYMNELVTDEDLDELQQIVIANGIGTPEECERAANEAGGFGLFIRRLVGLDREAAKAAFNDFLDGRSYSANQIEFVNLVIDELTATGLIEPRRLFESPFTDIDAQGPDAVFERDDVDQLFDVVADIRRRALAVA